MADITGPIRTLPGARHACPPGTMCDDHPERPAVARIQGETDSFGAELIDICQACLDAHHAARSQPQPGYCDWCHHSADDVHPHRDLDEGMTGPVYQVCRTCIEQELANLTNEYNDDHDD